MNLQSYDQDAWRKVWFGLIPPKVEIFVWQLLHGRLPVRSNLAARGIIDDGYISCPFCGVNEESVKHIFFDCMFA